MQRPPKGLPLIPVTPIHDAINRINGKQAELTKLALRTNDQARISVFVERAFAQAVLGLTGVEASLEQIAKIQDKLANGLATEAGPDVKILRTLASIKVLEKAVDNSESLTPDLLLRIHDPFLDRPSPGDEAETDSDSDLNKSVLARVGAFCQWAGADSFKELNALEQAAIAILRLLEIRAFQEGNVGAAIGAGSMFTMRAGWPPIIVPGQLRARFNLAVGEGLKMNTRPLIDLLAESIYETLNSIVSFAKTPAGGG
jgi:hypothetical protein